MEQLLINIEKDPETEETVISIELPNLTLSGYGDNMVEALHDLANSIECFHEVLPE